MNCLRILMISAAFTIALMTDSFAQSAQQYAVLTYRPDAHTIELSIDGDVYKEIRVTGKMDSRFSPNPALAESRNLIKEGWELIEMQTVTMGSLVMFVFYYKRPAAAAAPAPSTESK